jgi:glycosyltransferase involved in cell wall biosynthesis
LHVVYPGVHLRHTEPRACIAGPTIGTACRLVPIKGVDVLIRAFADLSAEFPGLHLEIAGDGPERERLEKCAAETRVGPRIRFLGWRGNLVEDLRRWRLFVMPSLEEAFGVAALEAMAVGLPLVGTRVGGLPELIEDGRTGLLVPPGDPEALGRAIRSLLLRPGLMLSMGTAGREKAVGEFSIDRMLSATREAYAQALALR